MSAIAAIVTPAWGYLISDSLSYDEESGELASFAAKVQTLPHAGAVVAARGQIAAWQWATELLGRVISFDQIEQLGPAALRAEWPQIYEKYGDWGAVEIIAMGWSHASRCVRAVIGRSPDFTFEVSSGDTIIAAPALSAEQCAQAGIELTDDPGRDLLKIITAQREFCAGPGDNGRVLVIGGRIVLTVLTIDTIGQRVIAELPMTL